MSFHDAYLTIFLDFFCIYGLAAVVSMITTKENGALLSVVSGMLISTFCGYGPSLQQAKDWKLIWWWRMCPGTYFAEAWMDAGTRPYAHVYNIKAGADSLGFNLGWFKWDCMAMVIIGVIYRFIAYGGLVSLERQRQR